MDASITRSISATTGTFSHVYAEVRPSPWATAIARIMASGVRSLRVVPSAARLTQNGSTIAISLCAARSDTASPHASRVRAVAGSVGSMRSSILPASNRMAVIEAASYAVNRSSSSNAVPNRPPRFIEPTTTLSSSAPSSSRSSRTSGVPSTPSTPGRDSATRNRSSRSTRLAMAVGRPRTPSAPRAGWSAATSMSPRSAGGTSARRARAAAAAAIASGCPALVRTSICRISSRIVRPQ
ncbi:MAG: hypothetical protein AUI14_26175 [Actinobacteria bacterium 13_2_20CM_2_71_6]|nr:MAG: hypothetical protein AUI14_26175 [Actinobacteria bacterium 13_2_20CM_2_71_6]